MIEPEEAAMARKARSATGGDPRPADPTERIIAAALRLAETRGWGEIALRDIAVEADMPFAELYARFPAKLAVPPPLPPSIDGKLLSPRQSAPPEGAAPHP